MFCCKNSLMLCCKKIKSRDGNVRTLHLPHTNVKWQITHRPFERGGSDFPRWFPPLSGASRAPRSQALLVYLRSHAPAWKCLAVSLLPDPFKRTVTDYRRTIRIAPILS